MDPKKPGVTVDEEPTSHASDTDKPFDQASPEETRKVGRVRRPADRLDAEGNRVEPKPEG